MIYASQIWFEGGSKNPEIGKFWAPHLQTCICGTGKFGKFGVFVNFIIHQLNFCKLLNKVRLNFNRMTPWYCYYLDNLLFAQEKSF